MKLLSPRELDALMGPIRAARRPAEPIITAQQIGRACVLGLIIGAALLVMMCAAVDHWQLNISL